GAWLLIEGITIDGQPVALPPMKLANPKHQPGAVPAPTPMPAAPPPSAEAPTQEATPPAAGGIQEYAGARRKINEIGTKVAAMPLRISNVPKQIAFIIDELLLTELQGVGFEA